MPQFVVNSENESGSQLVKNRYISAPVGQRLGLFGGDARWSPAIKNTPNHWSLISAPSNRPDRGGVPLAPIGVLHSWRAVL